MCPEQSENKLSAGYYYITCHEVITTATSKLLIFPIVTRSLNNENKVLGAHAERH